MVETTNGKNPEHPWDDNLPKNKENIQQFYQKSEQEIKNQQNENMGATNVQNSHNAFSTQESQWSQGQSNQETQWNKGVQNAQSQSSGAGAQIVKVKKNSSGDITDVMSDNGNVYSINEAIAMAKSGALEGVNVGYAKNGREYLRSNPNGTKEDNLDNLPTF